MSKKKYSKKPSQENKSKKKVVVTTTKTTVETTKKTPSKTTSRFGSKTATAVREQGEPLLYGKQNYMLMGAGVLLILLGYALMTGGAQPSPDVWDESIIYSFRRVTLGSLLVLTGMVVEVVAIFKK